MTGFRTPVLSLMYCALFVRNYFDTSPSMIPNRVHSQSYRDSRVSVKQMSFLQRVISKNQIPRQMAAKQEDYDSWKQTLVDSRLKTSQMQMGIALQFKLGLFDLFSVVLA